MSISGEIIMKKILEIDFKYFVFAVLITYVPFHVLEEAYFNLPLWFHEQYNIPKIFSLPHFLIGNCIFLTFLLIGFSIYLRDTNRNIAFGYGILIWSFINSLEHTRSSVMSMQISPGLFTGLVFLIIVISGSLNLKRNEKLNTGLFIKSTGIALLYWIFPISINIALGHYLIKIFP